MNTPQIDPENTPADLREELTELEFAASQRQLLPAEHQRMQELRGQASSLVNSAEERAERPTAHDGAVMKGDDSP